MNYLPLSQIKQWIPLNEIALFCVDNNYVGIVNDLTLVPHIEYDLEDLILVWDNFKTLIC